MSGPNIYKPSNGATIDMPVKDAVSFQPGDFVLIPAAGYAILGADAAAIGCAGIALTETDNTSGSSGDVSVTVDVSGPIVKCTHTGGSQTDANIGDTVYVDGANAVDVAGGVSNKNQAGQIVKVESASVVWVQLNTFAASVMAARVLANDAK